MDINILEKKIRSKIIKEYIKKVGINKVVCFTCGNATQFMRDEGIDVLSLGENEDLNPCYWWTQEKINKTFKNYFNATSGDLPLFLMYKIANKLKKELGNYKSGKIKIGSGETALCLKLAFPKAKIELYRDGNKETIYSPKANLNQLLKILYPKTNVFN